MSWSQTILNSLIMIVVLFNLVFSASCSYKESVTDNDGQKTINGYLLALFGVFAGLGSMVYKIIAAISASAIKTKKPKKSKQAGVLSGKAGSNEKNDTILIAIIDFWIMFGLSWLCYTIFNVIGASDVIEDMSTFEKIINVGKYIANTFVMVMYYGFIYGLFGGENCRIQETFISSAFNAIKDFGDSLEVADTDTDISLKAIKQDIENELEAVKTTGKGLKIDVVGYIKSSIGRAISTVAEFFATITCVYVSFRNIAVVVFNVIFDVMYFSLIWFASDKTEEVEMAYDLEVIGDVVGIFKSMFWTLVILIIIKILVKVILLFLPESISDKIYGGSAKLNSFYRNKLKEMSTTNLTSDTFAMTNTPDRLIRAAKMASGGKA